MCKHDTLTPIAQARHGSCLEHGTAHTQDHLRWSRRSFISTLGLAALGSALPLGGRAVQAFGQTPMARSLPTDDRILVLIQLDGGNDGLNTIVPVTNDLYYNFRPTLAIPKTDTVLLTDDFGFHPSLEAVAPLFNEGRMAIVQNVGYAQPDLSHFRSTDIWTTASDATQFLQTGWVGRYIYETVPGFREDPPERPIAVQIGGPSLMFQGPNSNMGMAIRDLGRFERLVNEGRFFDLSNLPDTAYGDEMWYLRDVSNAAFRYAGAIQEAARQGSNTMSYPDNPLAESLSIVARLIRGQLGTRIYMVSLMGFDTHANQPEVHATLLRQLAESVTAFLDDIPVGTLRDNLLVMTFSEFGRRVYENGSLGTDHGSSAPLFLFGHPVYGGFYGHRPALDDLDAGGNPKFDVEFRQIYATLLQDWLGVDAATAAAVLGGTFQTLGFLSGEASVAVEPDEQPGTFALHPNYPNPFNPSTSITYRVGQPVPVRLDVLDMQGRQVRTLVDAVQPAGEHKVVFDAAGLPSGVYLYRLQAGRFNQVRRMLLVK